MPDHGVQPFGFFATVEDLGGDGLIFAKDLGNEYFRYDEAAPAAGRRSRPAKPIASARG